MFGLGFWEIAMIVGAILFVAGPAFLPRLGRYLGRSAKELQAGAETFQANLREEMNRTDEPDSQLPPKTSDDKDDAADLPPSEKKAS